VTLRAPASFSFTRTVYSHGWIDLSPFHWNERSATLRRVITTPRDEPLLVEIREPRAGEIAVRVHLSRRMPPARQERAGVRHRREASRQVAHMLRLEEPMDEFHALCRLTSGYSWVATQGAGRLLRAPDPFEDLVKLICTTNCSWSLTRIMTSGLVEGLGDCFSLPLHGEGKDWQAFPTPEAMAAAPLKFYRTRVKAGYRAPHLKEIARRVATGRVDPSSWLDPERGVKEIREEIESLPGAGRYVSENMLKLLGRYEGLGLDSWCRRKFSQLHGRGRKVSDKAIERHYARFGRWRGLALWCDLTRDWIQDQPPPLARLRGESF
jgi:3-methyladenine DNA glycosylase/8-oxoguanine DNA glycosylase